MRGVVGGKWSEGKSAELDSGRLGPTSRRAKGALLPRPWAGRGLHCRLGIPTPVAQTKRPSTAAPARRGARSMRRRCAPPSPRQRLSICGRGLGGRTWVGQAARGARRCPRWRRRRAARVAPPIRPGGGAYRRHCCPLQRRRRPQVSAICSRSGGGGGGGSGGPRPAQDRESRRGASFAFRRELALFPPPRVTPLPPPRGPASAVLICPQFSGFSSPEPLRPLYLEDLGGFPECFSEHCRRFGHRLFSSFSGGQD